MELSLKKNLKLDILIFISYIFIFLLVFRFHFVGFGDFYNHAGYDTDGTLHFAWWKAFAHVNDLNPKMMSYLGYPYGYDITYIPHSSFFYDIAIFLFQESNLNMKVLIGAFELLTFISYPIAGLFMYKVNYLITKDKLAAFVSSFIFLFSAYMLATSHAYMSLNYIFVIPMIIFFTFKFIEESKYIYLFVLTLSIAVSFGINPYHTFYVSLAAFFIIVFHRVTLKQIFIFVFLTIVLLVLVNFEFISNTIYLITGSTAEKALRVINPMNELIPYTRVFMPAPDSFLLGSFSQHLYGNYIGLFSFFLLLISMLKMKYLSINDKKVMIIVTTVFILTIALMVQDSLLIPLHKLYFSLFGTFRSVSRFILISSALASIIIAIGLKYYFHNFKTVVKIIISIFIIGIVFLDGWCTNGIFKIRTNMTELDEVYKVVREDKNINNVAYFPLELYSGAKAGIPPNDVYVAQMFHQKKLYNGVDPQNKKAMTEYFLNKDVYNPFLVDNLKNINIDTIFIDLRRLKQFDKSLFEKINKNKIEYFTTVKNEHKTEHMYWLNDNTLTNLPQNILVYKILKLDKK